MVSRSPHTWLKVLPNHGMSPAGELQGFLFHAHPEDRAAALPFPADIFRMTCLYPVPPPSKSGFNADVLHILNNVEDYQAALDELKQEILEGENGPTHPAHFDCVPEADEENESVLASLHDQREWAEVAPSLLGLFHGFGLNALTGEREHKLYIVVQGCQTYACEDMHNLWLDANNAVSALEFAECEELTWLRQATLRNHGRLASRVAKLFNLGVKHTTDRDDPSGQKLMVRPTTVSYLSDIRTCARSRKVRLTSLASCTEASVNGVLLDTVEGSNISLLLGPRDFAHGNPFGSAMRSTPAEVLPTRATTFHSAFCPHPEALSSVWRPKPDDPAAVLRLSERFMADMQALGFNRNDGMLHLMPIILTGAR
tara:strand:- start:3982 stop:5091 length:1110 start_codon:yes stop_codon:yes gene_type:complete